MSRNLLIDALKVLASQLIVVHHLATYGPLSDIWDRAATRSSDWSFEYGRMAVQIFLVIGGFLAAREPMTPTGSMLGSPLPLVINRYFRLMLPLVAALAIAVPSALVARQWASYQFFPEFPTWSQIWSHILLVQTITGQPSLSAGVWYVSIDFQLFVLFTTLMWLGRDWAWLGVAALMLASLFYFNLRPEFDSWGIYFFGAYAMGVSACWAARSRRPIVWLCLLGLVGLVAIALDFRERILLSTLTALLLGSVEYRCANVPPRTVAPTAWARALTYLGNASYALFLLHFSVVMLANALYARLDLNSPLSATCAILACWIVSNALGIAFAKWVERPLLQLKRSVAARWHQAQP